MVEQAHAGAEGPSIEDADVIVAGGRGLGGPENFSLVEELAAGARRRGRRDARGRRRGLVPVRDAGRPDRQDGLAEALRRLSASPGAIQHKVGMQGSGTIVAINKDPNAPIFEFCDLGVVGDLHEIVPKLTELVRAAQGVMTAAVRLSRRRSSAGEFVAEPTDPADERIEVGILIVGAGPAGLAVRDPARPAASRNSPDVAERLGEVPVAVLEKGKQPGSHLLSGAVVNPRALRRLFQGRSDRGHAVLRRGRRGVASTS